MKKFWFVASLILVTFSCKKEEFLREDILPVAQRELEFLELKDIDCRTEPKGCNGGTLCAGRNVQGVKFFATCDELSCWEIRVANR